MRLTGSPETAGEGFSSRAISQHWEYCRPSGAMIRWAAQFRTPARRDHCGTQDCHELSARCWNALFAIAFNSHAPEADCGVAFL